MKLGYLGPHGTFTEQAAIKAGNDYKTVSFPTILDVLENVNNKSIDAGIVPIENSIEGIVNITLDTMLFDVSLYIQSKIILPIEQNLMAKKGVKKNEITKILSHPQALPQCKKFLKQNYPNISQISVNSTSEGAKIVSESDEKIAAIGIKKCAEIYKLDIIDENIQDDNNNYTQFIIVSKKDTRNIYCEKATSIAFSTPNEPGRLYKILDILALWDLNMTRIISRPMRNKIGEYVFFIDLEDNKNPKDIEEALIMLKRKTSYFKNLGSYPVFDYRYI